MLKFLSVLFRTVDETTPPVTKPTVSPIQGFVSSVKVPLNYAMVGLLAVIGVAAIGYAIYVAFRLASAEDEGKRKEAKQHLLWSIIAIVAAVVIFVLIQTVFSGVMFTGLDKKIAANEEAGVIVSAVNSLVGTIFEAMGALVSLVSFAAGIFAIYIGIKLATAEEDSKRKEAKKQMVWTVVAIGAAIALVVILNSVTGILIDSLTS